VLRGIIDRMTRVLERDDAATVLHGQLAEAREGRGGVVLVTGEAGIGKTTLVRSFLDHSIGIARTLVGACDPLDTPRPLGPLIDAARSEAPDLARRLAEGMPRAAAFATALDLVDDVDGSAVFVIEDLHWADEATLDLFTFLSRRLDDRPVLMVATFRSDEVDDHHPLRLRLGDVRAHIRARIELEPLSADAVRELAVDAGLDGIDIGLVHDTTGGNPFFVTEMLAERAAPFGDSEIAVPETVRDAVLARSSRLPPTARAVLEAAAIVPGRADRRLIETMSGRSPSEVDEGFDTCAALGLLDLLPNDAVEFRHELGRLAIEGSLPTRERRRLNAAALDALRRSPLQRDLSRLSHHAAAAGDSAAVLEFAPRAADEATASGAHREAAALLELAVRHAHVVGAGQQGVLWLRLADARAALGDYEADFEACVRAVEVLESADDVERLAEAHVTAAGAAGQLGRHEEDLQHLHEAGRLLGESPAPSRAAALLEAAWCSEHMLARSPAEAEECGQRAMALATAIDDQELFAKVAIQSGISLCMGGGDDGLERVRHGTELADRLGHDRLVAHGHSQIGSGYGELRRYDIAVPALRRGVEYASARELEREYVTAWLARCELETGDWDAAAHRASELADSPRCVGLSRFVTLVTLAWLRMRRGDPHVVPVLEEALDFAKTSQHLQRMWPAAACRAEHDWMHDRLDDAVPVLRGAAAVANQLDYRPAIEELSHWLVLAGEEPPGAVGTATTPFGLSAAGRPDLAATAWDERGCPYEAAIACVLVGDVDHLRRAWRIFDGLGADPMRDRTGRMLRDLGARVPRGPNRSTQSNPHGLTDRELDVLALLPAGHTNAEIGRMLHISERTVDHHVSRILSKLGASNRAEAATEAHRLGLVSTT
jgi:DNA-binding CsgD family transcriptional regulator/tetratricopeptide (TPR) repeat protein